ncbi:MAG: hypothetical protein RL156_1264 [Bacteroidota bacterium]
MNTYFRCTAPMFVVIALVIALCAAAPTAAQPGWKNVLRVPSYGFGWNPKNPRTMYVGGQAMEFYRSFDGGETWDTTYINGFVGSGEELLNVLVHPIDTAVVLVGGSRVGSLWRSSDCGKTWDRALVRDMSLAFLGESIILDKSNPDILYACDFNSGIFFRSTNRGTSWDSLSRMPIETAATPPYQQLPCSITQRSDSTNILFAGCLRSSIMRSDDTGRTWRKITKLRSSALDEPEIPQIHFSRSNPMVGYAITSYFFYRARPNGGMYKTTDGGATWREARFRDSGFWSMDSRPLPSGKGDDLVVGGFTEYFDVDSIVPGSGNILRSLDDGEKWWNYKDRIPYEGGPNHSVITLRFVGNSYQAQRLVAATIGGTCILEPEGLARVSGSLDIRDKYVRLRTEQDAIQIEDLYPAESEPRICIVDILGRIVFSTMMKASSGCFDALIPFSVIQTGLSFAVITRADGSTSVTHIRTIR